MSDYLNAVSRINEIIPIAGVVDLIGLEYHKQSGSSKVYSCFGHSDSDPSFFVDEGKNYFHCFSCGRKGSAYKLSKEYLIFLTGRGTVSFRDIQSWLSNIDPRVKSFTISYQTEYKPNPMKKREFMKKLNDIDYVAFPPKAEGLEQRRSYITGLMKGLDPESLGVLMNMETKQDNLFSRLLGESL